MPPGLDFIFMIVAMIALFYFLIIRPQRKRMMQHQEMQSQLAAGTRVLLTSGIYGTVIHVGERQLVVELAPGTEITVLKSNVARPANPDEEEFEFDDTPVDEAPDALSTETVVSDEELEQMFGAEPETPTTDTEDPK